MKVIDCVWELDNLGEKVVEINVEKHDVFNKDSLLTSMIGYDYLVVKVPMNMPDFNFGLSSLGFSVVETQMNISKRYKDFPFDDRLVKQIYPKAYIRDIETKKELDEIIDRMTPDMFSTDRIYLDPYFSHEKSCHRYQNWMRTEFDKGTSITKTFYDDINVGLGMERKKEDGTRIGLLGGIYEQYQSEGLGLMTACVGFINAHKENQPFKIMRTSISSNNIPMMQFYNYLGFNIDSMTYVFVKHNK